VQTLNIPSSLFVNWLPHSVFSCNDNTNIIDFIDRRKGLRKHLLIKVVVLNLRYHRFLCINRSAFSQQQSFCKILLIKCFKDILTLHKTKEKEDARISASFCFVQHQKYYSKEKPGELVVKILTSLTHKITWINLNKTKTLSSVPSNSSSEVPLFPARSFSSKNFAISSAGRFYQMENKIRNLGS